MSPRFISFEGPDGCGKSTHLERAAAWLKDAGIDVVTTREPGGTALGGEIRRAFLDARFQPADGVVEALLIFASRRQHLIEVIEPALAAGQVVLCDRFTDSTLAYQGAGRGVDRKELDALDLLATGARRPDLTLLFDLEPAAAQRRSHSEQRREAGQLDRIDRERLEFYERVRDGFLALATAEPGRFAVIDSSGAVEETARSVRTVLAGALALESVGDGSAR